MTSDPVHPKDDTGLGSTVDRRDPLPFHPGDWHLGSRWGRVREILGHEDGRGTPYTPRPVRDESTLFETRLPVVGGTTPVPKQE